MNDSIRAQIVSGEIAAMTIDTSIFERAGLALESGLLAQLVQFRNSDIKFVIAGTVANEVRRHLVENAEKAIAALAVALREAARRQVLPADLQQRMMKDLEIGSDGEALSTQTRTRARQRFDHWVEWVRATVLSEAEFASIDEIMRRYEASEPPFSAAGNKKHEFPDAVALSTLEGWARARGTKILAVTQDNDWKRYGQQSPRVVVVDDLADALAAFQRRAEGRDVARRFRASLGEGDSLGLQSALLAALTEQDNVFELDIQADSAHFTAHDEGFDVSFQIVEIPDFDQFDTVSYLDNHAVIRIDAVANADINVHFSFESIHSDDRSMRRRMISCIEPIEFEALVTVAIDAGMLNVANVEILPVKHRMSFAGLEPDWMSHSDGEDR